MDEFKPGMKVSLNNEFGVVIDSDQNEFSEYGIIRWDNANEKDFEDWRGIFGTFIRIGGKIIRPDYEFNFINNDGSLKPKT